MGRPLVFIYSRYIDWGLSSSVPGVVGAKDTHEETNEKQLSNYQSERVIMLSKECLKAGMIVTGDLLHWMVTS